METTNKELMKRFLDTNWESKNFNIEGFFSEIGKTVDLKIENRKNWVKESSIEKEVLFTCV